MPISVYTLLVVIALLLFIAALIKPAYPLCAVGGILLAIALLTAGR